MGSVEPPPSCRFAAHPSRMSEVHIATGPQLKAVEMKNGNVIVYNVHTIHCQHENSIKILVGPVPSVSGRPYVKVRSLIYLECAQSKSLKNHKNSCTSISHTKCDFHVRPKPTMSKKMIYKK